MFQHSTMDVQHSHIFYKLKPICDNLLEFPTLEHLETLKKCVLEIPSTINEELCSYISFPLVIHLKNESLGLSEDFKRELVEVLKIIFNKSKIKTIPVFFSLYSVLILQVQDRECPEEVSSVHEEMKLSVVMTITALIKNISFSAIDKLYVQDNVYILAKGVCFCIQIAKDEKFRALRIAALECLMAITYCHDEADKTDIVLNSQVADVFMGMLPGISTGLMKIILGDEKQGHLITMMALRAWGRIISMIMRDENTDDDNMMNFGMINSQIEQDVQSDSSKKRSKKWVQDTIEKLKWHICNLKKLPAHPHPKVRLELVAVCEMFIRNSMKNLSDEISCMIDILVVLSEDEYDEVVTASQIILNTISNQCGSEEDTLTSQIVEENFYNLVHKLPQIMTGSDESEHMFVMDLLIGHLKLLGTSCQILNSVSHLQHLITALVCISKLQYSNVPLLEEFSLGDLNSSMLTNNNDSKTFVYLSEKYMQNKLYKICHLLGQLDIIDTIANYLLDLFLTDDVNRHEITLILNEILSVKTDNVKSRQSIVRTVLDEYLNPTKWYLPVQIDNDQCQSISEAKNNLMQMSLVTEGVGKFATGLGKCFEPFLIKTLYFLIERAGNNLNSMSRSAIISLKNIADALEYENVTGLLNANFDYVQHYIIIKLRRIERNQEVLDTLSILMRHYSVTVLACLKYIVHDALLQSRDSFKEHNLATFLSIFKIFVECVQQWQKENYVDTSHDDNNKDLMETSDNLSKEDELNALDDIFKEAETSEKDDRNKTVEQMYLEDLMKKEKESDEPVEIPSESTTERPPEEIEITVSVLKTSLNFLPSKRKNIKLLALEILIKGIDVVKNWENELLPVVHLVWCVLENRFQETSEPLVVHQSVLLLKTMAMASKEFIRTRTTKKVLPDLCKYLQNSAKESKRGVREHGYSYTQAYKLQLALIENLSIIAVNLDVADQHLQQVALSLVPFLSSLQLLPLQKACLDSLKTLMEYNADFVYKTLSPSFENVPPDMMKNINIVKSQLNSFGIDEKSVK